MTTSYIFIDTRHGRGRRVEDRNPYRDGAAEFNDHPNTKGLITYHDTLGISDIFGDVV